MSVSLSVPFMNLFSLLQKRLHPLTFPCCTILKYANEFVDILKQLPAPQINLTARSLSSLGCNESLEHAAAADFPGWADNSLGH